MHTKTFTSLRTFCVGFALVAFSAACADVARADGDDRYRPRKAAPAAAPVYTPAPAAEPVTMRQETVTEVDGDCGCGRMRLSGGLPIWFLDEEDDTRPAPGMALDYWCDAIPLNYRVGVEGRHLYLGQENADIYRESPDKTTRVSYVRIPFSVEYMHDFDESITGYVGGGPDIINLANDISETDVGGHLSARVHFAFTEEFGMSVEAGYMWARFDGDDGNINLDGAFVSPMLTYTF